MKQYIAKLMMISFFLILNVKIVNAGEGVLVYSKDTNCMTCNHNFELQLDAKTGIVI